MACFNILRNKKELFFRIMEVWGLDHSVKIIWIISWAAWSWDYKYLSPFHIWSNSRCLHSKCIQVPVTSLPQQPECCPGKPTNASHHRTMHTSLPSVKMCFSLVHYISSICQPGSPFKFKTDFTILLLLPPKCSLNHSEQSIKNLNWPTSPM